MSVVLQRCSWLSKIYSVSKSRVSKVKNSGDIFTLFSPHSKGPCSKTVQESCPQIRVRLKNNLYLAPRSIGFDGKVFYSLWQEMEPPQLVVKKASLRLVSKDACHLRSIYVPSGLIVLSILRSEKSCFVAWILMLSIGVGLPRGSKSSHSSAQ